MTLIGDDARKCLTRSIRIRNTGNLRGFQIILTFVHPFLTDCRKVQKGETKKMALWCDSAGRDGGPGAQ